jgi:hypothetical protein
MWITKTFTLKFQTVQKISLLHVQIVFMKIFFLVSVSLRFIHIGLIFIHSQTED